MIKVSRQKFHDYLLDLSIFIIMIYLYLFAKKSLSLVTLLLKKDKKVSSIYAFQKKVV